jgi:hypothetical protein|tara:strand:+ start:1160 stop:1420 length:261 start_codon:yes stop_codon:yes gene_type:complete
MESNKMSKLLGSLVDVDKFYQVVYVSTILGREITISQVRGHELKKCLDNGGWYHNRFNPTEEIVSFEEVPELTAERVTGNGRWGCE